MKKAGKKRPAAEENSKEIAWTMWQLEHLKEEDVPGPYDRIVPHARRHALLDRLGKQLTELPHHPEQVDAWYLWFGNCPRIMPDADGGEHGAVSGQVEAPCPACKCNRYIQDIDVLDGMYEVKIRCLRCWKVWGTGYAKREGDAFVAAVNNWKKEVGGK